MDENIVVYDHPNPQIKSFIVPEPISAPRVETFKNPLMESSQDRMKNLGSIGAWVAKELLGIPGVMEIRIRPREILITKEGSASWHIIEGETLEILRRALRKKQIRIVAGLAVRRND